MISAAKKAILNRMNSSAKLQGLGDLLNKVEAVEAATYDFSVSGGAVGTVNLSIVLPANAVVTKVVQDTLVTVTSGGAATVQVLAGATALTGATAIASITGTGAIALASSATAIKVSASSTVNVAIATAALTAGKVRVFVYYTISQDT